MPQTRKRTGAFTLDLGQPFTDQLMSLIEYHGERDVTRKLDKTALIRWLIWNEFEAVKKKRNKSAGGA